MPPIRACYGSNSPNIRRRFRSQAGKERNLHSPSLLYLYPGNRQKWSIGPRREKAARVGKGPSSCHSVHIGDQQDESGGGARQPLMFARCYLPDAQIIIFGFSPKLTFPKGGVRRWEESVLVLVLFEFFHLARCISSIM